MNDEEFETEVREEEEWWDEHLTKSRVLGSSLLIAVVFWAFVGWLIF